MQQKGKKAPGKEKKASPSSAKANKVTRPQQSTVTTDKRWMFLALLVWAITAIVYSGSVSNGFVNWDDSYHIYENPNLQITDSESLRNIFSIDKGAVIGNFIPLTVLSFYLEKKITGGFDPAVIHMNSLLLHLLIVFFVMALLKQMTFNHTAIFTGGLLFGIHPMRVESVAWATERKDVLFALFFFAALIFYVRWIHESGKAKRLVFYSLAFAAALLSGLSKIQAVTIPLSMLALDYWFQRKLSFKLIREKTPFWILSLAIGLINIYTLNQQGSINEDVVNYTFIDRICIGTFSFATYLYKLVLPYPMSPLYTYPHTLPWYIYASPLIFISAVFLFYWLFKNEKRIEVFGTAFFFMNIMFLLQVVGAGQGFLADRFTYVAYFGLFAVAGWYAGTAEDQNKKYKYYLWATIIVAGSVYAYMSFEQTKIWKNGGIMWSHVIGIEKETSSLPYSKRGQYYRDINDFEKALSDFTTSIRLNPKNSETYKSRGKCYFDMVMTNHAPGKQKEYLQQAISDFTKGLALPADKQESKAEMLINRGAAYAALGNDQLA